MSNIIFDTYVKAYDVALFGRGKNDRARREAEAHDLAAMQGRSGGRSFAARALRGLSRGRRS